jgi:hypothetical protein
LSRLSTPSRGRWVLSTARSRMLFLHRLDACLGPVSDGSNKWAFG